MSELLQKLSRASDDYGHPFLLGFMNKYHIGGLIECFENPEKFEPLAADYIMQEGLA